MSVLTTTASRTSALVRAAHAGPTLAVTAFALGWGRFGAGLETPTLVLLGAAVLTGQLTIGWANDWVDAERDVVAGRSDKPVAAGEVGRRTVGVAALVALLACVVLSLSLGLLAGLVHLVAVAGGLAYDLRLKSTLASPLPYALSFGLLPAVATLAAEPSRWPEPTVTVAAALLGLAAHLANTVPDAEDDARTGVVGLPQRIGPQASAVGAGVLLAAAALVLLPTAVEGGGVGSFVATLLLTVGAVLGLTGGARVLLARRRPGGAGRRVGRAAFWSVVAAAGLVVVGLLAS